MVQPYITVMQTITLLGGGFITRLALRAFRRTGAPALRALAVGLGLVTLGALLAGVLFQVAHTDVETAIAVQSTARAVDFSVLAYSLYAEWPAGDKGADYSTYSE